MGRTLQVMNIKGVFIVYITLAKENETGLQKKFLHGKNKKNELKLKDALPRG